MPLELHWQQIALRLALAAVASLLIGLNRDEHGHPAGIRTTMLVCLAAALAMLQVNLLLSLSGKGPGSFNTLDLMRLPLGILSGIGFIGAGAIIRRENDTVGLTTAATLWYTTVLGLLFGGGQIYLGIAASILGILILTVLKRVESIVPRKHRGTLTLTFTDGAPAEDILRERIRKANCGIEHWTVEYTTAEYTTSQLTRLECGLKWRAPGNKSPRTPPHIAELRSEPGIASFRWDQ